MIREGGLYVLMGSKPMCTFPFDSGYPENKEECQNYYEEYFKTIQAKDPSNNPIDYEIFERECLACSHMHHKSLWKAWKQRLKDSVGSRYRFIIRSSPFGQRRLQGLFLNELTHIGKFNPIDTQPHKVCTTKERGASASLR